MIPKKHILVILLLIPFFMFMTAEEENHSSDSGAFIGKVLNFILLFGGLTLVLYKPLRKLLGERGENIEKAIKDAQETRSQSEIRLDEVRKRLDSLVEEIDKIQKHAEKDGVKEKESIIEAAQKETERIKKLASQEIKNLREAGFQELKRYAAELAISQAAENIKKKITPEDQINLIDKSIKRIDSLYEESSSG